MSKRYFFLSVLLNTYRFCSDFFLQDQKAKNRKPQKEKQADEAEGKRVKSSGSAQVDEYDQDTSDEEVRWLTSLFTRTSYIITF